MRTRIVLAALVLAVTGPSLSGSQQIGNIELIFLTSFGDQVRGKVTVSIHGPDPVKDVEMTGRGVVNLPYGTYTIECTSPSFVKHTRAVDVSTPKMKLVFGLALKDPGQIIGEGPGAKWTITGRVNSAEPRKVLIRLAGVVSDFAEETEADSTGGFLLVTPEQGRYFVLAIDKGTIVGQVEVMIDVSKPRSIDVGLLNNR